MDNSQLNIWSSLNSQQQTQVILFWLIVIALALGVVSEFRDGQLDWRSLGGNLSTELFGGVITFVVIDRVIGSRREQEAAQQATATYKDQLIRQLASQINMEAIRAAEELRAQGWLTDSSLHEVDLSYANLAEAKLNGADLARAKLNEANLQGANLSAANLQAASMGSANLENANLHQANLQGARLQYANLYHANLRQARLQGVNLWNAHLQNVDLRQANLDHADLRQANLHDADLRGANLAGANLQNASLVHADMAQTRFDAQTTLPDGDRWSAQQDLSVFTNPQHPRFWRGFDLDETDLQGHDFTHANLRGVNLSYSSLQNAHLQNADLENANLRETNLQGANLSGANLKNASLRTVHIDNTTILPDGSTRQQNANLRRFTDSAHPDFWRSDDPESPAVTPKY